MLDFQPSPAVLEAPVPASRDRALADALRVLAMDAVQAANSGHPGMPMGMADVAEVLWRKFLRHNPADPLWPDRDRFVISNGHGSALLYALLHLSGYALPLGELAKFRQLGSLTPGHPERERTPGVETTTGPLGQGFANAVGLAIAQKILAQEFNRPGLEIVDHYTYAFVGDGCLMEGISHEAASLAGTLRLGKLIVLYDDNGISIDSATAQMTLWFTEQIAARFSAYGWHVIANIDGHDPQAIEAALETARTTSEPSLLCCRTTIGKGSPHKANTGEVHGAPLGKDEVEATRRNLGWEYPPFQIPTHIYEAWDATPQGIELQRRWQRLFAEYALRHPQLAAEFERRLRRELPSAWQQRLQAELISIAKRAETIATRKASQQAISFLTPLLPELVGGSADLTVSNLTSCADSVPVTRSGGGNYIYYGVREFGMSAIMNGLAGHGGVIPFGGTFLTFCDYARNALRMAAMMKLRTIFVLTHDSIGLGEDGPTHQPIEHAACLRLIPNMDVWRPCDGYETLCAWAAAVERTDGPTALLLSRQNLPFAARAPHTGADQVRRGAYVLCDAQVALDAVIIATGSEVQLALAARQQLQDQGLGIRVVSMPSTTVFDRQDIAYRRRVLPPNIPRIAVEAGVTDFWRKYVGLEGEVIGIDCYGESAPAAALFEHFGLTVDNVIGAVLRVLARGRH